MASAKPPSVIHLLADGPKKHKARPSYLIYFITGNPGLINYYSPFLAHLYGLLSAHHDVRVYGASLPGFEVDAERLKYGREERRQPPFGLEEVVERVRLRLRDVVREGERVVLIGHSVGGFIALEVLRRERQALGKAEVGAARVVGVVGLMPTVMEIGESEKGRKLVRLLRIIPHLPIVAALLSHLLIFLFPVTLLTNIIHCILGFPSHAASTTAAFLKSRYGVYQALYMARDEIAHLTHDRWDEEIWGAAHQTALPHPRARICFLFAKQDHWVAEETREKLIEKRGKRRNTVDEHWKPLMEVDEVEGWQHGFCTDLSQSRAVAEKVKGYVDEIVRLDEADVLLGADLPLHHAAV